MSPIYLYNGAPLIVSGAIATAEDCCCGGEPGCSDINICETYTGNFTLSTNFTACEECSTSCEGYPDYGTSFTLNRIEFEGNCTWVSGPETPEEFCSNGILYYSADVNLTWHYNGGDCFWEVIMICLSSEDPFAFQHVFRKYGSTNPVGTYTWYAGDCTVTGTVSIS